MLNRSGASTLVAWLPDHGRRDRFPAGGHRNLRSRGLRTADDGYQTHAWVTDGITPRCDTCRLARRPECGAGSSPRADLDDRAVARPGQAVADLGAGGGVDRGGAVT